MWRNTLILPESNGRLAAEILAAAIHALDVVLMLVIGKGPEVEQIVGWADKLCRKTQTSDGNLRKVVWIRDVSSRAVREQLEAVLGHGELPRVAVLNFFDSEMARLNDGDRMDPVALERAFALGHSS